MKRYNEEETVLASVDKQVYKSRNLLAKIFRRLLLDRNINPGTFSKLTSVWVKNNTPEGTNPQALKANITTALLKPEMTWKTLLKGFDILNITHVTITIECHGRNGFVTKIVETLDNETYDNSEPEE